MAKDNNLQDFLTDIADAIREKKGTTEKINPQDFATEIANLSSGDDSGSGSGEASTVEYLDVSGYGVQSREKSAFICGAMYSRMNFDGKILIAPAIQGYVSAAGGDVMKLVGAIEAVSVNLKMKGVFATGHELQTLEEFLTSDPFNIDLTSVPRITKEQFYNLEA